MAFGSVFNLSSLNGSNGFGLNGVKADDGSGFSVSNAGDVNGDGTDDLIVGASGADLNGDRSGQSYVVFGSTNGFAPKFNLSSLNGSNGFALNGVNKRDFSGRVSNAGDINGDGTDDLIVGASGADPNGTDSGKSYVVFGSTNGFASRFNLSSLNGSNGFALNGVNTRDYSGGSVSNAGDINGDGTDDLIIGARFARPNGLDRLGQSYVVFGSTNGFASSFNLSSLNGSNGFALNGINKYDGLGSSVSNAGDVNGDGTDDLIIGAYRADPNGSSSGQSYVVFGSTNGFASSFNLSSLNGSNGFALNGINKYDGSGGSVSEAGDVNGDGTDDLIIGAYRADPNGSYLGQSYVVFGSTNGFASNFNLSSLNGSNGFAINGVNERDYSGISVSNAGDVNGDSTDDLIIGARGADPNGDRSGQSYVVFGSTNGFASRFNLSSLNGSNGFALNGVNKYNSSGGSVSLAGDINGDGTDDLIIGASGADPNGIDSGKSYVVFGQPAIVGDNNNNLLNGTSTDDEIQGLGGNDTLNGLAGNDSLNGGTGNDVLNGGIGNDTYAIENINDVIQETSTINNEIDKVESSISYTLGNNLENLTLTGTANLQGTGNYLNNQMIGNTGSNFFHGGGGADSLDGSGGKDTLNGGTGNDTYVIDTTIVANTDLIVENNTITTEIDLVRAIGSYTLGTNLENLILLGSSHVNGIGNNLHNLITGNTGDNLLDGGVGNDTLNSFLGDDTLNGQTGNDSLLGGAGNDSIDGGSGKDTLNGGTGNDTYIIDTTIVTDTDIVVENNTITTEIDLVRAIGSYTLGTNLENLILLGSSHVNGIGNNLHNLITGNIGDNLLDGGVLNDTLNGGTGNDSFRFNSGVAFNTKLGLDKIVDFTSNSDKIVLSKTTFTAITSNLGTGFSNGGEFATVTTYAEAQNIAAVIVYNTTNDRLFYNQNGIASGFGTGGAFAELLGNPNLLASDFTIIA